MMKRTDLSPLEKGYNNAGPMNSAAEGKPDESTTQKTDALISTICKDIITAGNNIRWGLTTVAHGINNRVNDLGRKKEPMITQDPSVTSDSDSIDSENSSCKFPEETGVIVDEDLPKAMRKTDSLSQKLSELTKRVDTQQKTIEEQAKKHAKIVEDLREENNRYQNSMRNMVNGFNQDTRKEMKDYLKVAVYNKDTKNQETSTQEYRQTVSQQITAQQDQIRELTKNQNNFVTTEALNEHLKHHPTRSQMEAVHNELKAHINFCSSSHANGAEPAPTEVLPTQPTPDKNGGWTEAGKGRKKQGN